MKESSPHITKESLQGQAFEIRLPPDCSQGKVHHAHRILDRYHARRHTFARPALGVFELGLGRGLPQHGPGAFDQYVHLTDFVVHARQVTHGLLEGKARPLTHEVHHKIAGGHGNANVGRADGKGSPQKQGDDAAAGDRFRDPRKRFSCLKSGHRL